MKLMTDETTAAKSTLAMTTESLANTSQADIHVHTADIERNSLTGRRRKSGRKSASGRSRIL